MSFQERLADAKTKGDAKGEAEASLEAARIYLRDGESKEALAIAKSGRAAAQKVNEAALESEIVQVIAEVLAATGDTGEATKEAYDALNIAKKAGDPKITAGAMLTVVTMQYQSVSKESPDSDLFKEGLKEMRGTAEDAAKAFRKLKDGSGHAASLIALARVYMLAEEPDKAKFAADMAYMLYNKEKDGKGFYEACITLSHAHIQRLDFASAMRYCNEAGALCMQFQDQAGLMVVDELTDTIRDGTRLRNEMETNTKASPMMIQKLAFQ
jgi:hypothetical protein